MKTEYNIKLCHNLLSAITKAQSKMIGKDSQKAIFEEMLSSLLDITSSEFGFIGEVLYTKEGEPYLKIHAITNISWNEETRNLYKKYASAGMEFFNLNTIYGEVLRTGKVVISNNPYEDPRRGGFPKGHPHMNSFLGVPFFYGDRFVGMAGIANRQGGYDNEFVEYLGPLLLTCANIVESFRIDEQRLYARDKINKANDFLQSVIDGVAEPIMVIDRNYKVTLMNKVVRDGYFNNDIETSDDIKCFRISHHSDMPCRGNGHICPLEQIIETGKPVITVHEHIRSDGETRFVEILASPLMDDNNSVTAIIESSRDITDRIKSEEEKKHLQFQLIQSQKMESLGRLAGGVAHDFNNILSAILGYTEISMMNLPQSHPLYDNLNIIKAAGQRAAELTRQLLAFSRKQVLQMKVMNLNDIVEGISKMLLRVIGEDVKLDIRYGKPLGNILADPGQIEQIIMNLAVNGRDAMQAGGRFIITTSDVVLGQEYSQRRDEVTPGPHVLLSFTDTGSGMTKEVQERLFEPFFTTKEHGKGTGLGLSTVYGIIKQHSGHIWVYSEPEYGTTFKIYFPTVDSKIDESPVKTSSAPQGGSETILIVEDDTPVRKLVVDTLAPLGYKILASSNGKEALDICDSYKGIIDVLLTDVVMPEMNGIELSERILKKRPSVKVLLMSGYSDWAVLNKGTSSRGEFLEKPFTPTTISSKLRQLIEK